MIPCVLEIFMDVIQRHIIDDFTEDHADAVSALSLWDKIISCGHWKNFEQLSLTFPNLETVGKLAFFSIRNGSYTIVASVDYKNQRLFIRNILSCADSYEKQF